MPKVFPSAEFPGPYIAGLSQSGVIFGGDGNSRQIKGELSLAFPKFPEYQRRGFEREAIMSFIPLLPPRQRGCQRGTEGVN